MSRAILISIHPEHVAGILSGDKIFEYRKVIPKHKVSYLVLYCTAPVKRVVAVAEVIGCIVGSPSRVWDLTSIGSGISRRFFREYFYGRKDANAFVIGNVYEVVNPLEISFFRGVKAPPQSYCYLDDFDTEQVLKEKVASVSSNSRLCFMGGIHGVGKGTISKKIFEPAGYRCLTASSLISKQGRITDHDKRVNSVLDNQSSLLIGIERARESNNRLLLDGHFTLINDREVIERIDIEVFRSMEITQLFLVKGNVDEISVRLRNRDNKKWEVSFLDNFQKEEESHARYVAKSIGIPLRILRGQLGV